MNPRDPKFGETSDKLAKHAFQVMRLYCREFSLPKELFVDALATLCIEVRETYPDGKDAFDRLAKDAQQRYFRGAK